MISPWMLYLIMRLDVLSNLFIGGLIASALVFVLLALLRIIAISCPDDTGSEPILKNTKTPFRWSIVLTLVFVPLFVLTPTSKQMAVIYVLPKVANNETIQEEFSELYDLMKGWLREQSKEGEDESANTE